MATLERAIELAAWAHAGQRDKGGRFSVMSAGVAIITAWVPPL